MIKKLLYTFFFGYAAFKWRRLIRTLIVVATIVFLIGNNVIYNNILEIQIRPIISFYILIVLISWVIKPFIVKENQP